jgi:predicted  nucleic acid-binding Zn-ribbon protein
MDSIITFPPPEPDLKLARPSAEKWAATLAEERMRFHEDQEALREREENLRDYEARLRLLQAEIEAGRAPTATPMAAPTRSTPPFFQRSSSRDPFGEDPGLASAWEKLHRARELLEAEQKNLRDERITLRELELMVKQRAEEVAEREARLAEREALVTAATPAPQIQRAEPSVSAVTRITRAPFEMARSVFGGKKAG